MYAANWHTWNLSAAARIQRSPSLQPEDMREHGERDRVWLLQPVSGALPPDAPRLRLGWRPERLLFLAQGRAPYQLLASHACAEQDALTHGTGVMALRGHAIANGPGTARLGARQLRIG